MKLKYIILIILIFSSSILAYEINPFQLQSCSPSAYEEGTDKIATCELNIDENNIMQLEVKYDNVNDRILTRNIKYLVGGCEINIPYIEIQENVDGNEFTFTQPNINNIYYEENCNQRLIDPIKCPGKGVKLEINSETKDEKCICDNKDFVYNPEFAVCLLDAKSTELESCRRVTHEYYHHKDGEKTDQLCKINPISFEPQKSITITENSENADLVNPWSCLSKHIVSEGNIKVKDYSNFEIEELKKEKEFICYQEIKRGCQSKEYGFIGDLINIETYKNTNSEQPSWLPNNFYDLDISNQETILLTNYRPDESNAKKYLDCNIGDYLELESKCFFVKEDTKLTFNVKEYNYNVWEGQKVNIPLGYHDLKMNRLHRLFRDHRLKKILGEELNVEPLSKVYKTSEFKELDELSEKVALSKYRKKYLKALCETQTKEEQKKISLLPENNNQKTTAKFIESNS